MFHGFPNSVKGRLKLPIMVMENFCGGQGWGFHRVVEILGGVILTIWNFLKGKKNILWMMNID